MQGKPDRESELFLIVDGGVITHFDDRLPEVFELDEISAVATAAVELVSRGSTGTRHGRLCRLNAIELDSGAWVVVLQRVRHDVLQRLTPRQRDVAERLADGLGIDAIAWELGITANTVKYHAKRIYRALDIGSRLELAERLET